MHYCISENIKICFISLNLLSIFNNEKFFRNIICFLFFKQRWINKIIKIIHTTNLCLQQYYNNKKLIYNTIFYVTYFMFFITYFNKNKNINIHIFWIFYLTKKNPYLSNEEEPVNSFTTVPLLSDANKYICWKFEKKKKQEKNFRRYWKYQNKKKTLVVCFSKTTFITQWDIFQAISNAS